MGTLFPSDRNQTPLRFVVLRHDWNGTHWDLMIEREPGGVLATWGIDRPIEPDTPLPARSLADHRRHYLTHEGEVSGGRGVVTRWDEGTCLVLEERPDEIRIVFEGRYLAGSASLRTTAGTLGSVGSPGWVFVLGEPSR